MLSGTGKEEKKGMVAKLGWRRKSGMLGVPFDPLRLCPCNLEGYLCKVLCRSRYSEHDSINHCREVLNKRSIHCFSHRISIAIRLEIPGSSKLPPVTNMGHLNHEGKIDLAFHRGAEIAVRQLSEIPIKNVTATDVEESAARPCLNLVREVFTQA